MEQYNSTDGYSVETLYRLRRNKDGKWYGTRSHNNSADGQWRKRAGKFFTAAGLDSVLKNSLDIKELLDIEIIEYGVKIVREIEAYRIKENKAMCTQCNDVIVSKNHHDFRRCKCGESFVDGGKSYLRRGGHMKDMSTYEPALVNKKKEE